MPLCFKEIIETEKNNIMLYGGRLGGKTNNTAKLAVMMMLQNPYHDIIMARSSYGSLADSSYSEVEDAINEMPDDIAMQFKMVKSPLRIKRKDNSGTIYFIGYGGSNTSRTKSIKPKHKIAMVVLEETQELRNEQSLNEAMASFRRHFGSHVKVIVLFNPKPNESHWLNILKKKNEMDSDWLVKRLTYLDILPFINDFDLREILKTKIMNYDYYRWFYLGDCNAQFGSVYPMFRKSMHEVKYNEIDRLLERHQLSIQAVVIGGDGAVNRDATVFVPLLIMNNGQSVVAPIFYHDPKINNVIGSHQLVQDHVRRWFDQLCKRFNLGTREEILERRARNIPIYMRIDNSATDLIQECKFFFSDRVNVGAIQKKSIVEMVGVVQSALSNNNIVVGNYGGYYNFIQNRFIKDDDNLLTHQLQSLVWNEKQTGYEPLIPNDVSDAFTYAVLFWYSNQENIQYFNLLKANNRKAIMISDMIKSKVN